MEVPTFVPTSQGTSGQYIGSGGDATRSLRVAGQGLQNILARLLKVVGDVVETILVCIFGRGARINANVRFWNRTSHRSNHSSQGGLQLAQAETRQEIPSSPSQERESLVSRIV